MRVVKLHFIHIFPLSFTILGLHLMSKHLKYICINIFIKTLFGFRKWLANHFLELLCEILLKGWRFHFKSLRITFVARIIFLAQTAKCRLQFYCLTSYGLNLICLAKRARTNCRTARSSILKVWVRNKLLFSTLRFDYVNITFDGGLYIRQRFLWRSVIT